MKKKDDIELEMQETVVEEPAVQEEVSMKDEAAEMKEQAKKTIQLIKFSCSWWCSVSYMLLSDTNVNRTC